MYTIYAFSLFYNFNDTLLSCINYLEFNFVFFCFQILLNFTRYIFDYLGAIVAYLAIAIPLFGGKFDDEENISAIISAVSSLCWLSTL